MNRLQMAWKILRKKPKFVIEVYINGSLVIVGDQCEYTKELRKNETTIKIKEFEPLLFLSMDSDLNET